MNSKNTQESWLEKIVFTGMNSKNTLKKLNCHIKSNIKQFKNHVRLLTNYILTVNSPQTM